MSLSHSYIVVVIGFSVTLSFGFIFYYHSYIFSLTFILFCFSSFFFFVDLFPSLFCVCTFVLLWSCLFGILFSVSLCVSVHLALVYFYFHKLLWWLAFVCFSFVIVLHAFNCVKLLSQLLSLIPHQPSLSQTLCTVPRVLSRRRSLLFITGFCLCFC